MHSSVRVSGSLAFLSLSLSLSLVGCKEEKTGVSGFVDGFSRRVCDAVVECDCEYPGGTNYDHCLQQLGVGSSTLAELNDVEGLRFDGDCADRQISEIGRLGCGVFMADPDAECERPCKVWVGPMKKGATCTTVNGYDNCHQGLTCDNGVCVDPCEEPDLPEIGEPCAAQFGCEESAWCNDVATPLLPVCAALPAAGEACLGAEQGYACDIDLMCDTSDLDAPICRALPGVGEECPTGTCAADSYCDVAAAPPSCVALPGLGDLCAQGICTAPNLCEGGVCVEPRPQVCGLYSGVPEGLDPTAGGTGVDPTVGGTGVDPTVGGTDGTGGFETEGGDTGVGGNSCCVASDTPVCDDIAIATCVCEIETACCTDAWTQACVDAVTQFDCGGC